VTIFLAAAGVRQWVLKRRHQLLPPIIVLLGGQGRAASWVVVGGFHDHEEALASLPDLHGFDTLGADVVDHGRPDRAGLVHPAVLLDQRRVVHQIQREAETTAHTGPILWIDTHRGRFCRQNIYF